MEVKVLKNIMGANSKLAEENRNYFKSKNILAINIMASPGAGKTSIIMKLIEYLNGNANIAVIEGDISSSIDAEKIEKLGIPVIQINTAGGCHLDANMIRLACNELQLKDVSVLFIENVGNLVCPSTFDLGESIKMVIASVPEGHDKPYKYTSMFQMADIIILNKIDLKPYINFDSESFYNGIKAVNQKAKVIEVSCETNAGIESMGTVLFDSLPNMDKIGQ